MNFNKNDGVALVLVMSLMVLGGILIPVLMRSTETHIDVAQHKESMSKSFYSADSGVEFVKANSKEIFNKIESSEDNNYINFDSSGEIKFQSDSKWFVFGE